MALVTYPVEGADPSAPIYNPGQASIDISRLPNLVAWLKGSKKCRSSDHTIWYDRGNRSAYDITGILAESSINAKDAVLFNQTQSVDLGSIMPISGDYSVFAVLDWQASATSQVILGSTSASGDYFALAIDATGHIILLHQGAAQVTGSVAHAANTSILLAILWKESTKSARIYISGVLEIGATGANSNNKAAIEIGDFGVVAGRTLSGNFAEMIILSEDAAAAGSFNLCNNYLTLEYGF